MNTWNEFVAFLKGHRWLVILAGGSLATLMVCWMRRCCRKCSGSGCQAAVKAAPKGAVADAAASATPTAGSSVAATTSGGTPAAPGKASDEDYVDFGANSPGSGTRITGIFVYPIKGCAGVSLQKSSYNKYGLRFDREWMVVDAEDGSFVTQRQVASMARIRTSLFSSKATGPPTDLHVTIPGFETPFEIPIFGPKDRPKDRPTRSVRVWDYECLAEDEGDAVAEALSAFLERPVRLVRMLESHARPSGPSIQDYVGFTSFADGFPFLVVTEASLAELNRRLGRNVAMSRFRPNLVVTTVGEDAVPFGEDEWDEITVGRNHNPFVGGRLCTRCKVPTVNQLSGVVDGADISSTLRSFHAVDEKVYFGRNMIQKYDKGVLNVGDAVTVVSRSAPQEFSK